ncbi:MAG: (2Fe-2S)-binding protein [Deltaproteobacteria bacterium]|nr:(2Fe-2S)-binding protein [Deltaproteobacteria bacterium]
MRVMLKVNGTPHAAEVEPRAMLSDFLRDELALTGTKVGCDTGTCGSCTVLVNGKAVMSCSMLVAQAEGLEVTTIEGLSKAGQLSTLQAALQQAHGVQCGFCTPGMVVSLTELLGAVKRPTEAQIREWLGGSLCRCTGYQNVVVAVQKAAEQMGA